MTHKIGISMAAAMFAVFAAGNLRGLTVHGRVDCATASAQDSWYDGSGDAEPSVSVPDKKKAPPPDVSGDWLGDLNDAKLGSGMIELLINQKRGKLSGLWGASFGAGKFTGTVSNKDVVHFTLKNSRSCHLSAVGMLVGPDEITCTYKVLGCGKHVKGDHGEFDITR